ncbi:MAG: glycosyltransferase family 4 protein, partial [Armatimonadota bacterium]
SGDEVVYIARLTHHKRQWLAVESLQYTKTPVRLIIAGQTAPGEEAYAAQLQDRVAQLGLQDRVTFLDHWISEDTKISLLENCLAVAYLPFNEDSYGFATLEAFLSAKPVITTTDAGGVLELVEDRRSGLVVSPEPFQIADALDQLYSDRALAEAMGKAARHRISELGISWESAIATLLS